MNLYLDDDSAKASLVTLLKKAGHQVAIPADAGLSGVSDPRHLTHTVQINWVMLTYPLCHTHAKRNAYSPEEPH
jgi:hypothetical protein